MVLDGKGKKKSSTTSSISLLFPSTAKHVRSSSQIDTGKCTHPCAASIFLKLTSESFNLNANSVADVIYRRFNWGKTQVSHGIRCTRGVLLREEEGVEEEAKIIENLVFTESFMEEEEERQMKSSLLFLRKHEELVVDTKWRQRGWRRRRGDRLRRWRGEDRLRQCNFELNINLILNF